MIRFNGYVRKIGNKYELIPCTNIDTGVLESFLQDGNNKAISVTLENKGASKTFDEVKSVFALCKILFCINTDRYPSKSENELMYQIMLEELAPRIGPEQRAKGLSEMSKWEACQFVRALVNIIADKMGLVNGDQISVQDIFRSWQLKNENDGSIPNPIDYDENGNLLDVATWRKLNCISFATGRKTDDLEIAHIISKGSRPEFRNCCWNFMLLEHELHIEVQHKISWEKLFELYPHLKPRYDNAFKMAAKLDQADKQQKLTKENAIDYTKELVKQVMESE